MSTISDALKKAQERRQGAPAEAPPSLPQPLPPVPSQGSVRLHSKPVAPVTSQMFGKLIYVLVLLILVFVIVGLIYYHQQSTQASLAHNAVRDTVSKVEIPISHAPAPQPEVPVVVAPKHEVSVVQPPPSLPLLPPPSHSPPPVAEVSNAVLQVNRLVEVHEPPPPTHEVAEIRPVYHRAARADVPVLGGTFYSTKNSVAIINGSVVKESESVGAYQVVKILPNSVKLMCDGEEVEIRLK